jgi:hypothetical protein
MQDIKPGIGEEPFSLLMHAYFGMKVKYCESKHKTVPVLNSAAHYKVVWGSGGISICILNHGTRWKLSGWLHILAISPLRETVPCTIIQQEGGRVYVPVRMLWRREHVFAHSRN